MPVSLGNRVREKTATTGTGILTLTGVPSSEYSTFVSALTKVGGSSPWPNVPYHMFLGSESEIGRGTLTSGGSVTLSRDEVFESTNGGAKVNWPSGDKTVILAVPVQILDALTSVHGQCRLARTSNTVLTLSPYNGNTIIISGIPRKIPVAGITLANTGLTAATIYFVYSYMNGTTMTLEASTTAYATSATNPAVKVKSGDETRTLVGMAYMGAGTPGIFVDSVTQRFTRSWFNRKLLPLFNAFTADRTTASATFVELSTEIRVEFASWAGEMAAASAIANAHHPTAGNRTEAIIAVDAAATALGAGGRMTAPANAYVVPLPAHGRVNTLSEGYHYLTLSGRSVDGGTATFLGSATPERCSLSAEIGGEA